MAITDSPTRTAESAGPRAEILLVRRYGSLLDPPKIFVDCEGSHLYDEKGTPYLDLQMWYSAASFGYKNQRLGDALKRQIDKLPQLACQYLHAEKIELAAQDRAVLREAFRREGPRPLQRGRRAGDRRFAQAGPEIHGQEPDVGVPGRIPRPHARRFGDHFQLSLSPALRTFRRSRPVRVLPLLLPLHL